MSFEEIQRMVRAYVRRVYGQDAKASAALPMGRGVWEVYVSYPKGRAFLVKIPHSKLIARTSNDTRPERGIGPRTRQKLSRKIRKLRREGYPQAQAVAIAHRMMGIPRP